MLAHPLLQTAVHVTGPYVATATRMAATWMRTSRLLGSMWTLVSTAAASMKRTLLDRGHFLTFGELELVVRIVQSVAPHS